MEKGPVRVWRAKAEAPVTILTTESSNLPRVPDFADTMLLVVAGVEESVLNVSEVSDVSVILNDAKLLSVAFGLL